MLTEHQKKLIAIIKKNATRTPITVEEYKKLMAEQAANPKDQRKALDDAIDYAEKLLKEEEGKT